LEIHGDGSQTRTFTYVSDTVSGIVAATEQEIANGEIFNIGNTQEISILELARLIKRLSGTPGELKYRLVPYSTFGKYEDVMRRVPDIDKAQRLLGFRPEVSLEEGLKRTMAWQMTVARSQGQEDRMPVEVEVTALAALSAAAR
jgi:UDP-glucose 4-epimerase